MTAAMGKVLVTGWPLAPGAAAHIAEAGFGVIQPGGHPDQAEMISLLCRHRPAGVIVRAGVFDRVCFDANPDLKVIAIHGAGHDDVDVAEATRRSIPVFAAPGRNAISVAEHVFALLLAVIKRTIHHDALVRCGGWRPRAPQSSELRDKTLGIVGFGAIGEQVAALALAFGMRVAAFDPVRSRPLPRQIRQFGTLEALLAESDMVSLHVPLTEATRNMIGAAPLARMKRGGILINCARGGVVDEAALVSAIESGHLAGAGLDTFSEEPPGTLSPAARCPGVVLSPHMAGVTAESVLRMSMCCAENVVRFLTFGACSDDLVDTAWNSDRKR